MAPIITLLTDFGVESTYPAQMKGVILGRCQGVTIVDVSHGVPPHDVRTAAFMLAAAAPAFPRGTIHVAVVDPQVGSQRRILAVETGGCTYLAPDNGLLTLVTHRELVRSAVPAAQGPLRIFSVENEFFFRTDVSSTFHGRDIFAPVAAAIADGADLEDFGPPVTSIERFEFPLPAVDGGSITGCVLYVDTFGNLVTNIGGGMLVQCDPVRLEVHILGAVIRGLSRAYSDVPAGALLAYVGSAGLLEIAVNRQSAAARLSAGPETPVKVNVAP